MMIDKGYYDYDYTGPKPRESAEIRAPRSEKATQDIFKRFGWGKVKTLKDAKGNAVTSTVDDIQAAAMRKIKNNKNSK